MAALVVLAGCFNTLGDDGNGNAPIIVPDDDNGDGSTIGAMISIPAGRFQRDADPANISAISEPFRMSATEVTRAQFLAVMGEDPSIVVTSPGTEYPAQNLNWYHAIAFCNKLSLREGLTPVYSVSGVDFATLGFDDIPASTDHPAYSAWESVGADWSANGYRLPTNAEWMWAAMGADSADHGAINTTGYAKQFAGDDGSNDVDDYVWYLGTSGSTGGPTRPVGSLEPNELGLYDMSGNVYEWCWDWDWWPGDLPNGEQIDYRGAPSGTERLRRGGSYGDWRDRATIAYITSSFPYRTNDHHGIRVVRR